jgi:hypothetical protein
MWDHSVIYHYEKKYYENSPDPPAKLFMCVGGLESSLPGFEKLSKFLDDRRYSSLQIESRVLENTGHSGTKGEGFARGLQSVFKRPSLQLPSTVLAGYTGTYKFDNGITVNIKPENGMLTGFAGNSKYALQAASETDFYLTSSFFKIHFKKDEKGNVFGFQLDRYGTSEFANKIK